MPITIEIVSSAKRFRSTTLKIVGNRKIEARVPQRFNMEFFADLLSHNVRFLAKAIKAPNIASTQKQYVTGDEIFIYGMHYLIDVQEGKRSRVVLDEVNKGCLLTSQEGRISYQMLLKYVSRFLLKNIEKNVSRIQEEIGTKKSAKISVKMTKSQWGSCSSRGSLSFSKKLIHYPQEIINYVIIHEVAHLYQHNHSKAFWEIVERHCRNYKELRKQLKEHKFG